MRVECVLHASQVLEQALIQLEPVREPELVVEEVQRVPLKVLIVLIVLIVLVVLVVLIVLIVQEQQPSVIVAPGS